MSRNDGEIDWGKTTFEGTRREQLLRTKAMTVRQRLEALDELTQLSERLRASPKSGRGASKSVLQLESGLVVFVPEVERLVGPFREQFDPAAGVGVPAHITLLYPFKPPDEITAEDLEQLGHIFAQSAAISFSLIGIGSFGSQVLYLVPDPGEPFIGLTDALVRAYPQIRPYGARFAQVVPHLTVAGRIASAEEFELISRKFATAARGSFPIALRATAVKLLDTRSGRWAVRSTFALGGAD